METILGRLAAGEDLSMQEMASAIDRVMRGEVSEGQIGLLLTSLRLKGETVDEVAGAAAAMRGHMRRIESQRQGVIDTCGTGGDGASTFNISTAAALVAAAAGVPVAKHGNRRVTSKSGSADVLARLGVNIEADLSCVSGCLDELGICFCFAPLWHQAMKHVAPVRAKLGVPTIFNLLGPLANPAGADYQLLGVARPELRGLLSAALARLGTRRALVVRGDDGLDEVTLAGPTRVTEVSQGHTREFAWTPADFGLEPAELTPLKVAGPDESAAIIQQVLSGQPGPARDIVVANAAAALWTAGHCDTLPGCAAMAADAIDSGAARELLARLVERTRAAAA
ncbi:MAG: anthranilate phosphoribosyltransferase [Pirellulales bacterium]